MTWKNWTLGGPAEVSVGEKAVARDRPTERHVVELNFFSVSGSYGG